MEQNNNIVPKNVELDETIYDKEKIKNLIYNIRGKKVMLDSDVAMLYHRGASLKDLGKKCFAINKIEDSKFIEFVEQII